MIEIIKCTTIKTEDPIGDEKGSEKYCSIHCDWNKEINSIDICTLFDSVLDPDRRFYGFTGKFPRLQICIKTFNLNDKNTEKVEKNTEKYYY